MKEIAFQINTLRDSTRYHLERFRDQRKSLILAIKQIAESASTTGLAGMGTQLEAVDAKIEQLQWFTTELGKVYNLIPDEVKK